MSAYWNEIEDAGVWSDDWKDEENGKRFVQACAGDHFDGPAFSVAYELTEDGDEHLKKQRAAAYNDLLDGLIRLVEEVKEKLGSAP